MSDIKRVAFTTIGPSPTSSSSSTIASSNGNSAANNNNTNDGAMGKKASSSAGTFGSNGGTDNFVHPSSINNHSSSSAALKSSSQFGEDSSMTTSQKGTAGGSATATTRATKTFRLGLSLFEPNSNSFPEFNYSKLMHLEKKKQKKIKQKVNGFSDPFEENDNDVQRIAKEFEKKYGSSYGTSRSRDKKDDFCDIGLGYDENDSFIDNTEAYDEVIPEEVETVEGGFYINSGALEFKRLSNLDKTDEIIKMPTKTRKRTLSSSSEESAEESVEETNTAIGQKSKSGPVEKRHKSTEVSDKEKSKKKDKKVEKIRKEDEAGSDSGKEKDQQQREKAVKTTTVKDMLKAKRDSFLKMQEGEKKVKLANGVVKGSRSSDDDSSDSEEEEEESGNDTDTDESPSEKRPKPNENESEENLRTSDVKLPDTLSTDLVRNINDMKDTAKSANRIGKNFHFDEKLIEKFLRIDDVCQCLDKPIRNIVFAHLEYQLSLPKYFLLRKVKQLRIKEEKLKTKKAFIKLKKTVSLAMPPVLLNYEMSFRKVTDFRESMPADELQKMENPPKFPKKRFPWNDTLRNLLYDLYQVRWTSYTVLRTRKETFEEFVSNYLKEKVVEIWPNGWMKYEELKKELDKRKNAAKKKDNKKLIGTTETQATSSSSSSTSSTVIKASSAGKPKHKDDPMIAIADGNNSNSSSSCSSSNASGKTQPEKINQVPDTEMASQKGSKATNNSSQRPAGGVNSEKSPSHNSNNNNNFIIDLVSPSKRTDHSISTLLSSAASSPSSRHSVSPSGVPKPAETNSVTVTCMAATTHSPPAHIITIDNLKTSDIIKTSNKLLNNNNTQATRNVASNSGGNDPIRCDSSSSSSSESDGVEIVDVYPGGTTTAIAVKKSATVQINKNKYKKGSNSSSRSDSPNLSQKAKNETAVVVVSGASGGQKSNPLGGAKNTNSDRKAAQMSPDSNDSKYDVDTILIALKELENMQAPSMKISSAPTTSQTSHTNGGNSISTSSLFGNKDKEAD